MARDELRAQRSFDALFAMGRILATTAPYERVVAGMMAIVSDVLEIETCGFFLYDAERDELVLQRPGFDAEESVFAHFHIPLSVPGPTRQVFLTRRPAIVNDALNPASPWYRGARLVNSRTILVVPLVIEGRGIGVLSLMNKRTGGFDADDEELATLLAPHLALTIDAAAKHQKLEEQQRQLDRALQVHATLSTAIVSAPRIGPLAESLAQLLGRTVILLDPALRVLAWAEWPLGSADRALIEAALQDGLAEAASRPLGSPSRRVRGRTSSARLEFVVASIAAGGHQDGYVAVVESGAPLDVVDVKALEHAATLFAFQLLRERTALEVERRVRGELFQELLSSLNGSRPGAADLLQQLGASTTGPWRVARLELLAEHAPDAPSAWAFDPHLAAALAEAWMRHGPSAPLIPWRSGFAAVLPDPDDAEALDALADALLQALAVDGRDLHFTLTLGGRVRSPGDLARSLEQAEDGLSLAARLGLFDQPLRFEQLGVERVLLRSLDGSASPDAFVDEVLGPLVAYDAAHGRDLLTTLRTYVAADYEPRVAARELFVHVNTLRFRLKRIAELLEGAWPRSETRFRVELALRLRDLQEIRARRSRIRMLSAP